MAIPSISDAFKDVTTKVSDAIAADPNVNFGTIPKQVYFMHGHPNEIVSVLQSYTNSPTKKNQKYDEKPWLLDQIWHYHGLQHVQRELLDLPSELLARGCAHHREHVNVQ